MQVPGYGRPAGSARPAATQAPPPCDRAGNASRPWRPERQAPCVPAFVAHRPFARSRPRPGHQKFTPRSHSGHVRRERDRHTWGDVDAAGPRRRPWVAKERTMKRRLGPGGAVLMAVVLFVLAASVPASATTTVGSIPLGTPFLYGEYAAGSSSVLGETVDGAAAYGGDATVTSSMVGASPASVTAPGGVTMDLGGDTNAVSPTTLAHGHGEYLGSFSGTGNAGTFTH